MSLPNMVLENEFGDKFLWSILGGDSPAIANIADQRILGNISGVAAPAAALTLAQIMAFLLLTTFTSGAGTVGASDTVLQAIQKLSGNVQNRTVIANLLTAFSAGAGTVSSADTILQALQKLTGNTQNLPVTGNLLTGLAAGSNTTIIAGNSILIALANLQAQIDAL